MKWPTATHRFRPGRTQPPASHIRTCRRVPCLNQRFPFHRTRSGRAIDAPTAVHAEGDKHETPNSCPASRGRGLRDRPTRTIPPLHQRPQGALAVVLADAEAHRTRHARHTGKRRRHRAGSVNDPPHRPTRRRRDAREQTSERQQSAGERSAQRAPRRTPMDPLSPTRTHASKLRPLGPPASAIHGPRHRRHRRSGTDSSDSHRRAPRCGTHLPPRASATPAERSAHLSLVTGGGATEARTVTETRTP